LTVQAFEGVSIDHNIDQVLGSVASRDWRERKARHADDDLDAPNGEVIVAVVAPERVVGYVSLRFDADALVGQIPNVVVDASLRGQGLGRRLLELALDRFRERGMKVARIETLEQNPIGRHLYPSVGFQEVARQIHFAMRLDSPSEPSND
jgi:ribosomal protein S18 acetylase RimI-like enzyme